MEKFDSNDFFLYARASLVIFLDFPWLVLNKLRDGAFWILSAADEPRARHFMPDCTPPQRAHRLQKVCISCFIQHVVMQEQEGSHV